MGGTIRHGMMGYVPVGRDIAHNLASEQTLQGKRTCRGLRRRVKPPTVLPFMAADGCHMQASFAATSA